MRSRRHSLTIVCALASLTVALGGCGGSAKSRKGGGAQAKILDIYSDLPLHGADATETAAINNGIRLALSQEGGRAGQFSVHFKALDDSTAQAGGWDAETTLADARQVAGDPRAIYDIGDFDSEASEISMPIMNEAGIAQVSPSNTYNGLTSTGDGSVPGEPAKYAPTDKLTYLRLVPRDFVQAGADLLAMAQARCQRVALADDGTVSAAGLVGVMELFHQVYGIDVVGVPRTVGPGATSLTAYAGRLKAERITCFEFAGSVRQGVAIADAVHAAVPTAKIFGPSELCTSAWTNSAQGGVVPAVDRVLECTQPTLPLIDYHGGATFQADYAAAYGVADPSPWSIYGYEAMKLGLDTIARLGSRGDDRAALVAALFAIRDRRSVIGTYSFDHATGDTTLRDFGLYKVAADGNPTRFVRVLHPQPGI
jgi:branched-chain amino acid transport system substrate-binding protein